MNDRDPAARDPESRATRPRIVSLVPSSTETLLALGADVVACSRFCEQPQLMHVGGTKNPDIAAIVELAPDVVVLDSEENRVEDHDEMVASGLNVFVSDVVDLDTAFQVVEQLASLGGVPMPPGWEGVHGSAPADGGDGGRRSGFVPIWRRPWMTITSATYGGSLLTHLGIDLVGSAQGTAYPTVELDDIATEAPDLVLVPSEPYDFGATHLAELAEAFPSARVVEVDGQDLFWWGIRTSEAITRLSAVLAPPPMP